MTTKLMTEFIEKELNIDLSLTRNKSNRHVFARCMAYYAFLDHMHMSFSASGKVFKKTHATVMHSYRNILPDLRKIPKYAHIISKIDEIFELIRKGEEVNHIITETKSTLNQKKQIIELKAENNLLKVQLESSNAQLEAYKSRSSLLHLIERIPEHQIDAVGLRLDAMVKMLA